MKPARGQAMLEALGLCLALTAALLVPVSSGRPIAGVLVEAILGFLRAQAYVLSIV